MCSTYYRTRCACLKQRSKASVASTCAAGPHIYCHCSLQQLQRTLSCRTRQLAKMKICDHEVTKDQAILTAEGSLMCMKAAAMFAAPTWTQVFFVYLKRMSERAIVLNMSRLLCSCAPIAACCPVDHALTAHDQLHCSTCHRLMPPHAVQHPSVRPPPFSLDV